MRPHLKKKVKSGFHKLIEEWYIREISYVAQATRKVSVVSRDPKDNKILECALSGKADLIVTADQDLIKLKTFEGIGIVHPKTLSWIFPEYFRKKI